MTKVLHVDKNRDKTKQTVMGCARILISEYRVKVKNYRCLCEKI